MGKFERTWRLMGASWKLLKQERKLVVFPLLSGLASVLVIASFSVPLFNQRTLEALQHGGPQQTGAYTLLFLFYFASYLVGIFFNSALIACALEHMNGGRPTLGYGLKAAWERFPQIFGWAFLASTVGFLLRAIEQRVGIVGRIVVGMLGMAWSVTAFLVVPVLIAERRGPIEAYKESVVLLKRSWGEQIIGNVSFGLIFGLLGIVPAMIVGMIVVSALPQAKLVVIGIGVVYIVALMLIQSTLSSIYQAAVYRYAADGQAPPGFEGAYLEDAFRRR